MKIKERTKKRKEIKKANQFLWRVRKNKTSINP